MTWDKVAVTTGREITYTLKPLVLLFFLVTLEINNTILAFKLENLKVTKRTYVAMCLQISFIGLHPFWDWVDRYNFICKLRNYSNESFSEFFREFMEDARESAPNSRLAVRLGDSTNPNPKVTNPKKKKKEEVEQCCDSCDAEDQRLT